MGTGITGLRRIAKAGVIPVEIQQKYYNKWILRIARPLRHGPFGLGAVGVHVGHQGPRRRGQDAATPVDKEHLNERARRQFYDEVGDDGRARERGERERDETLRSRHALQPQDRRLRRRSDTRSTAAS